MIRTLFIFLILFSVTSASGQELHLRLDNVEELAEEYSPEWQAYQYLMDFRIRGEEAEVTRINPTLNYDLEFLDDGVISEYEHFAFLAKEFRTPGHFSNLKNRRDTAIREARQEIKTGQAEWLAEIRANFVMIVLIKNELDILEKVQDLTQRIIRDLEQRSDEGEVSGIDIQLLRMGRHNISSQIQQQRLILENEKSRWLTRMGLVEQNEVVFTGDFLRADFFLPNLEELLKELESSPSRLAGQLALERSSIGLDLEQSRRIPSFELRAGYNVFHPDFHGFIVGFSIPLPLLNRNRKAIEQSRSEIRYRELSLSNEEENQVTEAKQLFRSILFYRDKLENYPENLDDPEAISRTPIELPGGERMRLGTLADVRVSYSPANISRENASRMIVTQANIAGGDPRGTVNNLRENVNGNIDLSDGFVINFEGQFDQEEQASSTILFVSFFQWCLSSWHCSWNSVQ